ncbi:hypothetical protein RDWZM_005929 [Blomia tropicalis]|uniref:FERM domain-containing protein n=1 Tax=Blomia tropicalis TaxID=40697 RepID=A0A9Q0M6X3_BLOTA|nr:hypothetical protein RDWZM_005929 [Blomia tropicalis]
MHMRSTLFEGNLSDNRDNGLSRSTHKGQDLLDIVYKHLSLLETVYFGLRFVNSKGYSCWLEPNVNVVKQVKGIEPITFYLGVKFYASDPCKLVEECTRYQFFLQIKQDIQQSRLIITTDLAAQLLAYIIQSELGDYDPRTHQFGYISEFRLIANQSAEFENKVCDLHKQLIGQIPAAVELQFLERIKWLDLYGCELHSVIAEDSNEYFLGLSPHGIIVLKNKMKVANYFWPRVLKTFRKGRYFMVKVIDKENEENTYGFELSNKDASKMIHKNCKEHREFFRLSQNGLNQTLNGKYGAKPPINRKSVAANVDRPTPTLVRVPSRRYQRMGIPDGSEAPKNEFNQENGYHESKPNGMSRHNSTPSLMKGSVIVSSTRYANPYGQPEQTRGLFSKSASASPLSVRSAFVSRYDYGQNNYVSHMKRNSSSLSLQKMKYHRMSDCESEVSKCSRSSRHSSRSHKSQCRRNRGDDSETDSQSSRKRRHRRRSHYGKQEQPQLVQWNNDLLEKRPTNPVTVMSENMKHSNAIVRNVTNFYGDEENNDRSGRHQNRNHHQTPSYDNRMGNYLPVDMKKFINHELVDSSNMSENEKRDIKFTNVESAAKLYKLRQSNGSTVSNGAGTAHYRLEKVDKTAYFSSSHDVYQGNLSVAPATNGHKEMNNTRKPHEMSTEL